MNWRNTEKQRLHDEEDVSSIFIHLQQPCRVHDVLTPKDGPWCVKCVYTSVRSFFCAFTSQDPVAETTMKNSGESYHTELTD